MGIEFTPGRVTVTGDDIIIEGFTFKPKGAQKGVDITELQKVAIKWAMNKLAEGLEGFGS